jgi:2-haloacid dehalogenase
MASWSGTSALTFDCYGTLVDWEAGILRDLRRALGAEAPSDDVLLGLYADAESRCESGSFRPYREVLQATAVQIAAALGVRLRLAGPVFDLPAWPLFPDTAQALRALQARFRLCVTSNVDRDLFDATEKAIGLRFDEVVTADQVRSYKPGHAHWLEAMRRMRLGPADVVHVAQSLHHDVVPAKALGIRTVWVDRRAGRPGGATRAPDGAATPDLVVTSLAELASLAG